MIYQCGGIDKRTIEKFEKVRFYFFIPRHRLAGAFFSGSSERDHYPLPLLLPLAKFSRCLIFLVGHRQNPATTLTANAHRARLLSLAPNPTTSSRHHKTSSVTDCHNRKPPNSARVPSSMPGSLTSSRLSVSVVSPSISPSGSSRPPSTTSPSLTPPVTVISSRT